MYKEWLGAVKEGALFVGPSLLSGQLCRFGIDVKNSVEKVS